MTVEERRNFYTFQDLRNIENKRNIDDRDNLIPGNNEGAQDQQFSLFAQHAEENINMRVNMAARVAHFTHIVEDANLHQVLQEDLTEHLYNVYRTSNNN